MLCAQGRHNLDLDFHFEVFRQHVEASHKVFLPEVVHGHTATWTTLATTATGLTSVVVFVVVPKRASYQVRFQLFIF